MKFFVSGKIGAEMDARQVMQALREAGHEITYDWTQYPHLRPYDANAEMSSKAAVEEIEGVKAADCQVMVVDPRGLGMYVELGAALAMGKPVRVICNIETPSMFLHHPLIRRVENVQHVIDEFAVVDARPRVS